METNEECLEITSSGMESNSLNSASPEPLARSSMIDKNSLRYKRHSVSEDQIPHKKQKSENDINLPPRHNPFMKKVIKLSKPAIPGTYWYKTRILVEKLQNEDTFYEAFCEVKEWLKKTKYSKKKTVNLFSLMQNIYFHVLYLSGLEENFEFDATKLTPDFIKHIQVICKTLYDIVDTFKSSQEQNSWRYFTKKQKRFIKLYAKHCKEWKNHFIENLVSYEIDFEKMENQLDESSESCSDSEDSDEQNEEHHDQDANYLRPVSPSLLCRMEYATSLIFEKLSKEETFSEGANSLLAWLEEGDCAGKNKYLYPFLLCIHNHVIKMHENHDKYEENVKGAKALIAYFNHALSNLMTIKKIYAKLYIKRDSSHSATEGKSSFALMKRYTQDFLCDIEEEINKDGQIKEVKKHFKYLKQYTVKIDKLRETGMSLRRQIEEVHNNIAVMKSDHEMYTNHLDNQIAAMRNDLQNSQRNVLRLREENHNNEIQLMQLRRFKEQQMERDLID